MSSSSSNESSSESEVEIQIEKSSNESSLRKQPLRYAVPQGFSELEVMKDANITKEDLCEGNELFLVKMPLDFPPDSLNGETCSFVGSTPIDNKPQLQDDHVLPFVYDVQVKLTTTTQGETFSVLVPSKKSQKIQPAGNFQGEVNVKKQLQLPSEITIPEAKLKGYNLPEGLQQRFIPFGAESTPNKEVKLDTPDGMDRNGSTILKNGKSKNEKKQKKRKSKQESATDFMSSINTETSMMDFFELKKNKKKAEHKEDTDVNDTLNLSNTKTEKIKTHTGEGSDVNGIGPDTSVVDFTAVKRKKKTNKDQHGDEETQCNSQLEVDVSTLDSANCQKEKKKREEEVMPIDTDVSIPDTPSKKKKKKSNKK